MQVARRNTLMTFKHQTSKFPDLKESSSKLKTVSHAMSDYLFEKNALSNDLFSYTDRFATAKHARQQITVERIYVQTHLLRMRRLIQNYTHRLSTEKQYLYRFSSHFSRDTLALSESLQQSMLASIESLITYSEQWPATIAKKSYIVIEIEKLSNLNKFIDIYQQDWCSNYNNQLEKIVKRTQVLRNLQLICTSLKQSYLSNKDLHTQHLFAVQFVMEQLESPQIECTNKNASSMFDRLHVGQYLDRVHQLLCHNHSAHISQYFIGQTLVLSDQKKNELKELLQSIWQSRMTLSNQHTKSLDELIASYPSDHLLGAEKIKVFLDMMFIKSTNCDM